MQSLRTELCKENQKAQHMLSLQSVANACPVLAADRQPVDIPPQ